MDGMLKAQVAPSCDGKRKSPDLTETDMSHGSTAHERLTQARPKWAKPKPVRVVLQSLANEKPSNSD